MKYTREENIEYCRKWRAANKDRQAETHKIWREKNKEQLAISKKEWADANKEKTYAAEKKRKSKDPAKHTSKRISWQYGVDIKKAEELYERSLQTCDSCGYEWSLKDKRRLCVDHDHNTGAVRGILCGPCNLALGKLSDSIGKILALAAYLERHNGN